VLLDYDNEYPGSRMLGFEGSHLYRIGGRYHLFTIHSAPDKWFRQESCYSMDTLDDTPRGGVILSDDMHFHGQGVAQGGVVDTPDGRWYAFMFQDRGAAGRMPILMPLHWEHGRPVPGDDGLVPEVVCNVTTAPQVQLQPVSHSDDFSRDELSYAWQWNHIPRLDHVQVGQGRLRLTTDTVTDCLTNVPNVLTMRATSPVCVASVNVSGA